MSGALGYYNGPLMEKNGNVGKRWSLTRLRERFAGSKSISSLGDENVGTFDGADDGNGSSWARFRRWKERCFGSVRGYGVKGV